MLKSQIHHGLILSRCVLEHQRILIEHDAEVEREADIAALRSSQLRRAWNPVAPHALLREREPGNIEVQHAARAPGEPAQPGTTRRHCYTSRLGLPEEEGEGGGPHQRCVAGQYLHPNEVSRCQLCVGDVWCLGTVPVFS